MTSRSPRAAAALIAALVVLAAPIVSALPAAAAPVVNALFFSNPLFTDATEEDATMIAGLTAGGITVTVFDGGDGSASAWEAALAGKSVLVIPESSPAAYTPGGTSAISDAAATSIGAFVTAGGTVILGASDNEELLSSITGLDYTGPWATAPEGGPWDLQIVDPALPSQIFYSDGTYPVDPTGWASDLLDGVVQLYTGAFGEYAVGKYAVGSGAVYSLAYDWFPGTDSGDEEGRASWNKVLVWAAGGPVAAPALANTGLDVTLVGTGAAGMLMLGLSALVIARTRRLQRD